MKVAICHRGFAYGDAIGNDIAGMYQLLERLGMQPTVVCEWNSHRGNFRVSDPRQVDWRSFDLVIYHHSFYWNLAETCLRNAKCPIVFKYHNITPAHFFEPYSARYFEGCTLGHGQTKRLIELDKPHVWLADSRYNRAELIHAGADPDNVHVVAPFNRTEAFLRARHAVTYQSGNIEALFVGRLAPNKGHIHLLHIAKAFARDWSAHLLVRVVGGFDLELERYRRELADLVKKLGIERNVEFSSCATDGELQWLFERSHLYLSCSEHEGFCVPVVEAQAVGLPIVAADTGAIGETAGEDQLLSSLPKTEADYSAYAAVINKVLLDTTVRNDVVAAGYRNVRSRFSSDQIENAFIGATYKYMQP